MADYSGGGAAFSTNWHGHEDIGDGETIVEIDGAWTGSIFFEARVGNSAAIPIAATPIGGGAAVTSLVAGEQGAWRIDSGGLSVRARFAPGSGNPNIRVRDAGF